MARKLGKPRPPLYNTWVDMRYRCRNPNSAMWHRYGGRGISVCDRWNVFANFIEDMGDRPEGHSLDRINNDGNYEPSNCRWATHIEQQMNKSYKVFVEIEGVQHRLADLARDSGLKSDTIADRAKKGMTLDKCLAKTRYVFMGGYRKAIEVRVANQLAATHCRRGHEWTEENTLPQKGGRLCRECYRMRKKIGVYKCAQS